jgi:hypothetical protein
MTKLNNTLLADDQVVIANSEDNLQRALHALRQTVKAFGMEISHQKTKIMAFRGTAPIKSKIVIDNMILEQTLSHAWAVTFHIKKRNTYIPKSQIFYKY